jgi:hypothetical protein
MEPGLNSKIDGAVCTDAASARAFCVDGVCCQTECAGLPLVRGPGKQGTCTLVPEGVKHRDCADQGAETCGFDGTCDGLGACRRHPAAPAARRHLQRQQRDRGRRLRRQRAAA